MEESWRETILLKIDPKNQPKNCNHYADKTCMEFLWKVLLNKGIKWQNNKGRNSSSYYMADNE